jgi:hypothetical protein
MTVEIGDKATQFPEEEYINGIFFCSAELRIAEVRESCFKFSFFYINKLLFSKQVISLIV